jgi:hypothetical protein
MMLCFVLPYQGWNTQGTVHDRQVFYLWVVPHYVDHHLENNWKWAAVLEYPKVLKSHDMYSLISGYYPRNLEYPRYNLQNTWNSRRRKTKLWLNSFLLRMGSKIPMKGVTDKVQSWDGRKEVFQKNLGPCLSHSCAPPPPPMHTYTKLTYDSPLPHFVL